MNAQIARLNGATVRHADGRIGRIVSPFNTSHAERPAGDVHLVYWFSEEPPGIGLHDAVPAALYEWVPADRLTIMRVGGRDLHMRPGHSFVDFMSTDAGRCTYCEKPIVYAMCDNGDTYVPVGMDKPASVYTSWFHTDGSPGHGTLDGYLVLPAARCPKCKGYDMGYRQEAYGDRSWCNAPDCDYTSWYDIGD